MTQDPSRHLPALALAALLAATAPARAETMLSFYLGASHTSNSDVHVHQPSTGSDATFHDVRWNSDSLSPPVYYGIRLTQFLGASGQLGMGLDFTHDKLFSDASQVVQVTGTWNGAPVNESAPMNRRVQLFNISHGLNLLALNMYYRWALRAVGWLPALGLRPYAGAGPCYYVVHAENTVNGHPAADSTKGAGAGYQLLAGLQAMITQKIGAFIEAKYSSGTVEVDVAGGRADTTVHTTQLLVGVSLGW